MSIPAACAAVRARVTRASHPADRRRFLRRARLALLALLALGLVAGLLDVIPIEAAQAATAPGAGEFIPLTQARIVDSRTGQGLTSPVSAGNTYSFQVTGQGGIPSTGVSAVAMTVSLLGPTANGWATFWPEGTTMPTATSVMGNTGHAWSASVITKVGATSGKVSVKIGAGSSDVVVDVQGYYTTNAATTGQATFVPLPLTRIYNANSNGGYIGAAQTRTVPVLGKAGVPTSGVAAVAVNITAVDESVDTWMTVWPGGTRPAVTTLNAPQNFPIGALVQVGVAADGTISVYNTKGTTNFFIDVEGYYLQPTEDAANYFTPVTPERIVDTRSGLNTGGSTSPLAQSGTLSVPVRGVVGSTGGSPVIPDSEAVTAVMVSVTATGYTGDGWLEAWAEGAPRPAGTFMNPDTDVPSITGSIVVPVGTDGRISIYTFRPTHVIVDVQGYFMSTPAQAPPAPGVSSGAFPANGWVATGTSGSLALSMAAGTAPAVRQYKWSLDDPSLATAALVNVGSDNATGTVSGFAPADGWHTLYVQAVNTAANTSPVAAYPFGVGVGVTTADGTNTARYVRLNARASAAYGSVTWKYRRAAADGWTSLPVGDVTSSGTAISTWPVSSTTSGASSIAPELVWDARTTLANDGAVALQACFTPVGGGTALCNTDNRTITLDQVNAGSSDATTDLAVGTADLLTGNLRVSANDASVGAGTGALTLARTFNTLDPNRVVDSGSGTAGVFGPGWTTALPVDSAGSPWSGLSDRGNSVVVTDTDGIPTTFARSGSTWSPVGDDADDGLTLTAGTAGQYGPATWTVRDLDGDSTQFAPATGLTHTPSPAGPNGYRVGVVTRPGSAQVTTYAYDASGRPQQLLAPVPSGSTCTSTTLGSGTWSGGCKALWFTYGTGGNANGRLVAVTLRTTDNGGTELDVDLACYAYDANQRLAAFWDPRDGSTVAGNHPVTCGATQYRPVTYTYDGSGRIASVTPSR